MPSIMLRPDLKTAGGEVSDIMRDGEFVGTLTLVYREADRLSGSVQLEQGSLSASDKQEVLTFMQTYVQNLIDALKVKQCDVLVTYSDYDHIIATQETLQTPIGEPFLLEDEDFEWVGDPTRLDDIDPDGFDEMEMTEETDEEFPYELVIVAENRKGVEYHVYDQESELIAEARVQIYGTDVVGEVDWKFDPFEEEMELVCELIVSDIDENEVDTIVLHMKLDEEIIETIELTHEDLLEDEMELVSDEPSREDYTVILARDDGDTLTYEIYQQSYGGLPIGTATVDISYRQLTGFIDFREPGTADDRELIATLLLEELDKEKEYETVNLSMLYRNKLIDEVLFENVQLH
jgi:hypothetical protein